MHPEQSLENIGQQKYQSKQKTEETNIQYTSLETKKKSAQTS